MIPSSQINFSSYFSNKHCKYFKRGKGDCPFNDKCFYLHAYPDGTKAQPKPVIRRRRQNADGELDLINQNVLWDFLEERQNRPSPLLLLELESDLEMLLLDLMIGSYDSDSDGSDGYF